MNLNFNLNIFSIFLPFYREFIILILTSGISPTPFISIIHHNAADLKYIFRWKEWSREKMIKRPKKNELWRATEFIPSVEPIGSIQGYPARRIAIPTSK